MTKHIEGTEQGDARSMLELGISAKESGQMGDAATWFERAYEACLPSDDFKAKMALSDMSTEDKKYVCEILLALGDQYSELGDTKRTESCWKTASLLDAYLPDEMTPHFARMKLIQHYIDSGAAFLVDNELLIGLNTTRLHISGPVSWKAQKLYAQVPEMLVKANRERPGFEEVRKWADGVLSEEFEVLGEFSQLELDVLRVGDLRIKGDKLYPDLVGLDGFHDIFVDALTESGKVNLPFCRDDGNAHKPIWMHSMLAVAAARLAAKGYSKHAMEAFDMMALTYDFMSSPVKNLYDGYTKLMPAILFWLRPDAHTRHKYNETDNYMSRVLGMTPEEAQAEMLTWAEELEDLDLYEQSIVHLAYWVVTESHKLLEVEIPEHPFSKKETLDLVAQFPWVGDWCAYDDAYEGKFPQSKRDMYEHLRHWGHLGR